MAEFLHMGGYAQFVWPSYVLTFLIIALNIWGAVRMHAQARDKALRRLQMGPAGGSEAATKGLNSTNQLSEEGA